MNTLESNISENAGVDQGTLHTQCTENLMYAKVQPFKSAMLEQAIEHAFAQEISLAITFIS